MFNVMKCIFLGVMLFSAVESFAYSREGLIAEYDFTDNSALDTSGNGNHGIIHNVQTTEDRVGNARSAMLFNGQDAWIEIPSSAHYNSLSNITVSLWICPQKGPNGETRPGTALISKQPSGPRSRSHTPYNSGHGGLFDLDLCYQDNSLKLYFCSQFSGVGSEGHIANMTSLEYYQWQHIAITANRSENRVRFYVNGELVDDAIYSLYINIGRILSQINDEPIRIGKRKDADFDPSIYYLGVMDDIKIYDRALLASEIEALAVVGNYIVTLNSNDGSGRSSNVLVAYNQPMPEAPTPLRTGWSFTGYFDSPEGGVQYYMPTMASACSWLNASNMTLYAHWTANSYTLNLNAGVGAVTPSTKTVTFDNAYGDLPMAERPDYLFKGWWTGVNGQGTQILASSVVAIAGDHTLYANWEKIPLLCKPGVETPLTTLGGYEGFLYSEGDFDGTSTIEVRGTVTMSVSRRNESVNITAKIRVQDKSLMFKSPVLTAADPEDVSRAVMTAQGGEILDLSVGQTRFWGTLSGGSLGGEVLVVDGMRNRFADRQDVEAQAILNTFRGYYTLALPAYGALSLGEAEAAPEGTGYLTITVGNQGHVNISGVLADGTKFSKSSTLILFDGCGPEACVPLFVPLYAQKGWLSGLLWFDPVKRTIVTDRDLSWFLRWEKPGSGMDGFSELLEACGGFYSTLEALSGHYRFSAGTNAVPYFYNGGFANIQSVFPSDINVAADGTRLVITKGVAPLLVNGAYTYSASENSSMATLTFREATGIFSGNFKVYYDYTAQERFRHRAVTVQYSGVLVMRRSEVFDDLPAGLGFYLVPDNNPALAPQSLKRSYPIELDSKR